MKLSVVTISFNQARFLEEAIDSVRLAVPGDLEYVIVDPGSTDGSRAIIESRRDRFAAMVLDPDRGPSDGLNRGFAQCHGDVLGYLNADDRYPPGALDNAMKFFETHPESDVLFASIAIIDEHGRRRWRKRVPDRFDLRSYAERACNVYCPSTFFRRDAFLKTGGFNLENRTCWDGELAVDLALSGARLACSSSVLGQFRVYPDSITGSRRLWEQYQADRARIRERIYASGVPRFSPARERQLRLLYKINPVRQLRYLLAA